MKIIPNEVQIEAIMLRRLDDYLDYFKNDPEKQERVRYYSRIPGIFDDEFFLITMINLNDPDIEKKLIKDFENNKIDNANDFWNHYNLHLSERGPIRTKDVNN